jgi:hypothetical protein
MRLLKAIATTIAIFFCSSVLRAESVYVNRCCNPTRHGQGGKHRRWRFCPHLLDAAASEGAFRHLRALQDIASESGGNRAAGTLGYDRSAEYVAERLKEAWQRVRIRHLIVACGSCTRS